MDQLHGAAEELRVRKPTRTRFLVHESTIATSVSYLSVCGHLNVLPHQATGLSRCQFDPAALKTLPPSPR